MSCLISVILLGAAATGADLPADFTLPPPPGTFIGARPDAAAGPTFHSKSPLVATSYFYWYDARSKAHVVNYDGTDALTDHPPTLEGFSYKSVDWHAKQPHDMMAAGIDMLLPVYWGTPLGDQSWSDEGLPRLVAARERLFGEGKEPPAIGMFYDTSTLRYNGGGHHIDLSTPAGRLWFYGTIRNFWSQIPPKHRAMFRRDFGTDLFLVKMLGWPRTDPHREWSS